ncbi:GapS6b family protein [Pseudomonas sp. KUIN-1]|uniref:GapS6b family protein n=1 Tax=Pseudomonas sp. KUIN-1 TaxID=2609418 RepID=UPI0012607B70|nr:hypothetical protein [Pseudomonas sp. KUIN-1]BBN63143.1 hypothetical protein KUIN1_23330 [Pseudomonas sp. KUIN-1]
MSTIEQNHSGSGDNVRDKIFITIKALAPDNFIKPMEMVFESLRKKDRERAKIQMSILKSMAHQDQETDALLDAISIYGELVESGGQGSAWGTVFRIASAAVNPIVKDVCLAAMLRLSSKTEKEVEARKHYASQSEHGPYAKEAFLSFFADQVELEAASQEFVLAEGEMTGIVEGAFRLQMTDIAVRIGGRLLEEYPSYNAKVLRVLASAMDLNYALCERHLWLCTPDVKQRLDILTIEVVDLLERSNGADLRLYDMACPILNCYQGAVPSALLDALKKYCDFLEPVHSETFAQIKALGGDDSGLTKWQRDLHAAQQSPKERNAWCSSFLAASSHTVDQLIPFIHLATPAQITEWLTGDIKVSEISEKEISFARLFASSFRAAEQNDDLLQRGFLAKEVQDFAAKWGNELGDIAPGRIFELAEKLFFANLPDKALIFTSELIGQQALWPSGFVVTHLRCLLEAQQFKTFDDVLARVTGFESSVSLMNLCSLKDEKMGDVSSALKISDQMIELAPRSSYCWYRGCYLRDKYSSLEEQRAFHARVSDLLLLDHSREAAAILFFMARAGNFKRAEAKWVDWFIQNPQELAIDFVDFYFGLSMGGQTNISISPTMPQCLAALQFTQGGVRRTKLIVEDHLAVSECTLKGSSQLGQLLLNSVADERFDLGLVTYIVEERIPPYIACMRMAMELRHIHNDGSDIFAMMETPSDPADLVPFLEEKLGRGNQERSKLRAIKDIPLFMRGHGLYSDNAFKAALNCWTDICIPKSLLYANGNEEPYSVVLDAYSISYLAVTDLAQGFLDLGIKFILPSATKIGLSEWIEQISHESFMMMGVTDTGKLYRTTASDIRSRNGHVLRALNLILHNSSVGHPGPHNAPLEVYSIRDAVDRTVYDAMELSSTNNIPWLCMDAVFAALHGTSGRPIVNAYSVVIKAMASASSDFDHKRHGLLLYAIGSLPLPLSYAELQGLAEESNYLAGFILLKIIQNHGRQIFVVNKQPYFLLDLISAHLRGRYFSKDDHSAIYPAYTPATSYSSHVFNHGMALFLSAYDKGTREYRFAAALGYLCLPIAAFQYLTQYIIGFFIQFAQGHFIDLDAVKEHLTLIASAKSQKN